MSRRHSGSVLLLDSSDEWCGIDGGIQRDPMALWGFV